MRKDNSNPQESESIDSNYVILELKPDLTSEAYPANLEEKDQEWVHVPNLQPRNILNSMQHRDETPLQQTSPLLNQVQNNTRETLEQKTILSESHPPKSPPLLEVKDKKQKKKKHHTKSSKALFLIHYKKYQNGEGNEKTAKALNNHALWARSKGGRTTSPTAHLAAKAAKEIRKTLDDSSMSNIAPS